MSQADERNRTGEAFVSALSCMVLEATQRLGQLSAAGESAEAPSIEQLLRIALKNELEATEIAARWLITTPELDVKLAFARQAGDEARHYRLIAERLGELGVEADKIDPRDGGYSPLFTYLAGLETTIERVAAGQFTREGIAIVRNQCFIEFCYSREDQRTAELYRQHIQPDEEHHHELGKRLLLRYASSASQCDLAGEAAQKTLELAEELQEMARMKSGISRAPGC